MIYGLILMLMAFYKAAALRKESSGLNNLRLAEVLMWDQAVYFLACASSAQILQSLHLTVVLQVDS